MIRLSVNLNKVALVRNTRDLGVPDVLAAARRCLAAGADGITVHPRPDGRHVRPDDVRALADAAGPVRERGAELNVEGYPSDDFLALVRETRPDQCTLVPDAPGQRTSDHGWDVARHEALLDDAVARLHDAGVRVSLFVDAAARAAGAGLGVNAGHDLNTHNLPPFAAAVPGLAEVSIGHAFVADALEIGYAAAVRAHLAALGRV